MGYVRNSLEISQEQVLVINEAVFFFKQKTAYEIGLGIPAEPLFRSQELLLLVYEFSHFPPAVHFDLIRKQAVVIPALSRYFFDSSEISESVNFCVMEAITLCRLDTPIIFIEARINLCRFVVTGCAAKTSATVTFP